mmetsp:Transcript_58368/g.161425  ORF Transcript_58368/g.161425 Transcript_58368/m.161425 type:complete len:299 (+) Transcript_58368:1667-2563(+)
MPIKDLDAREADEALVPPSGHAVEHQGAPARQRWDHHALRRAEAAGHERGAHDGVRPVVGDEAVKRVLLVESADWDAETLEGELLSGDKLLRAEARWPRSRGTKRRRAVTELCCLGHTNLMHGGLCARRVTAVLGGVRPPQVQLAEELSALRRAELLQGLQRQHQLPLVLGHILRQALLQRLAARFRGLLHGRLFQGNIRRVVVQVSPDSEAVEPDRPLLGRLRRIPCGLAETLRVQQSRNGGRHRSWTRGCSRRGVEARRQSSDHWHELQRARASGNLAGPDLLSTLQDHDLAHTLV